VNAGGSQAGISGWDTSGSPILYFLYGRFSSDSGAFWIFQGQLEFASQRIDGCAGALPHALAFETHVADSAPPGRDYTPDCTEVGTVGVLLIQPPHDVRRDANEGAQSGGRFDAVLSSIPRGAEHDRHLLEIIHEETFRVVAEICRLARPAERI